MTMSWRLIVKIAPGNATCSMRLRSIFIYVTTYNQTGYVQVFSLSHITDNRAFQEVSISANPNGMAEYCIRISVGWKFVRDPFSIARSVLPYFHERYILPLAAQVRLTLHFWALPHPYVLPVSRLSLPLLAFHNLNFRIGALVVLHGCSQQSREWWTCLLLAVQLA